MRAMNDVSGYSTVFLPGESPALVIKSISSPPRLISMRDSNAKSLSALARATCSKGFAYLDQKVGRSIARAERS